MTNFERKIKIMSRIRSELDCHIWSTFEKYIKAKGILFNQPDQWEEQGNSIYFTGQDGCMGCYDNMSLSIPMEFFTDPTAFDRLEQELIDEKERAAQAKIKAQQDRERNEYKRLKKQFEG